MKVYGIKYGKPFIEINDKVTNFFMQDNKTMVIIVLIPILLFFTSLIMVCIYGGWFLCVFFALSCIPMMALFLLSPNFSAEISPGYLKWKEKK